MSTKNITQIGSYRKEVFSFKSLNGKAISKDIYSIGNGKKIVVILQELPGIGQETLALADKFVTRGYTAVLPHLFGPIGKKSVVGNFARVCISREFRIFARSKSSRIVDFLSALCTSLKNRHKVKGVAVIGMCLTGNFAISLIANSDVLAGYASQPSLPLGKQNAIHISPEEILKIKDNLDIVGPMHCGHFVKDGFCTPTRMKLIKDTFNYDNKERVIFHELPDKGHSILTRHFVDEKGHPTYDTLQEIFDYFDKQLT